jgi:hypothetical protein
MSSIAYLAEVRGDLLDAGRREFRRRGGRRAVGLRDRFSLKSIVVATSVVTLLAAGTIGWFMRDDIGIPTASESEAAGYDARGRSPETAGPMPSPVPGDELRPELGELSVPEGYVSGDQPFAFLLDRGATGAILSELSRVIRTAELGLVIQPNSFNDRFAQVIDVATDNHGFVATSTSRERSGTVTMRVPADNFTQTLQDLRALGDVEVQTIQGRDVTAEYVDLRARIRIAKARRQVLLRLMDRATSIEQTIRVQNALDEAQLQIEGLQGQLRFLDNRTSLATIQVHLREEGVEIAVQIDTPSIPNALERAGAGFVGVIAAIIIGIGYLVPLVAIGLAIWFVVVQVRRHRRVA